MPGQRIQKLIAQAGIASRREAESLIRQGRVSLNGKTAQIGARAGPEDKIRVNGKPVQHTDSSRRVIMLNKPQGFLVTRNDPGGRKIVFDLLPPIDAGRWINIGRLDINTTGLLLFTSDGEFANRIMHPSGGIEREYLCRIYGTINSSKINKLKQGIKLDSGKSPAFFSSIRITRKGSANVWARVVLEEGRYREVRRLWEAVGCSVNRLLRTRFGNLSLPESLAPGHFTELPRGQIESLASLADKNSNRA